MTAEKIALVTGGNRGIGFEIARQLAQKGITVILTARRFADADYAAQKLATDAMSVVPLKLDVTSGGDIKAAVAFVADKFGRLDILINNAGVNLEENKKADASILRETFEINTIAPYLLTKSFLPLLKKSPAARIVNQSSYWGSILRQQQDDDLSDEWIVPAYSASKAALNMLTVIHARVFEKTNIKVNAAHPGWVRTRMGGDEAPLSPSEGAQTVIRLALLEDDGPTGKFFHGEEELPW